MPLESNMERTYSTGVNSNVNFFTGVEVEHTPAYGMETLFVTGLQETSTIQDYLEQSKSKHIFFGANHSFNDRVFVEEWIEMIEGFLKQGYWCSLDIPLELAKYIKESNLNNYAKFIPQLRVVIPDVAGWNANTTVKIDDIGFNKTNPGVWSHRLTALTEQDDHWDSKTSTFTSWSMYSKDRPLDK